MAELFTRLRATIAAHNLLPRGARVVIGVSGGPDSLALLHALCALRDELGLQLTAAHLDHQLRGVLSAADADFVRQTAAEWGVPAFVGAVDVAAQARENRLSLEEAGRIARYAFLASVAEKNGASLLATAHNADDQVETILMHFLRGSGLAGLRGMLYKGPSPLTGKPGESREGEPMPPAFSPLTLVRPLLDVTRAEVQEYCARHGLAPRYDASNEDTTFFRNRLRREALPFLEQFNPNLREVLRRAALAIADDYDLVRAQVDHVMAHVARAQGEAIIFDKVTWATLHPSLQRGTLREAVRLLRRTIRNLNWEPLEQARRIALEKEAGARATLPLALELVVGYNEFTIAPVGAQPETFGLPLLYADRVELRVPGETLLPANPWTVTVEEVEPQAAAAPTPRWQAHLDRDAIEGPLVLRRREPGDRFAPAGMEGHTKLLAEFMIDDKIPQAVRDQLPLLCDARGILWVCGWRAAERARVTPATRRALRVQLTGYLYRDHRLTQAPPGGLGGESADVSPFPPVDGGKGPG